MSNSVNDRMSSKDLFAFLGRLAKKYINNMRIDYDGILESFNHLEQQIGKIPSFSLADKIPETYRENLYEYHLLRLKNFLTDMSKIISRRQIGKQQIARERALEKKFENELKGLTNEDEIAERVLKLFPDIYSDMAVSVRESAVQMTDEELLSYYVRHWEILFTLFIEPIWINLKEKALLPQKRKELSGREAKVMQVRDFLDRHTALEKLRFFFMNMDTKLRNGIVHLHYYIDPDTRAIVYFYREGQNYKEKRMEMSKFDDICSSYSAINLIIFIIIGNRLELSNELKREKGKLQ